VRADNIQMIWYGSAAGCEVVALPHRRGLFLLFNGATPLIKGIAQIIRARRKVIDLPHIKRQSRDESPEVL
jgi:hypothetical protein